jgi:hypothetical protein
MLCQGNNLCQKGAKKECLWSKSVGAQYYWVLEQKREGMSLNPIPLPLGCQARWQLLAPAVFPVS